MVEQSSTLYEVKNRYESTLQNYILDFNPHKTIKDIRERFITTCVSSCVLCYVLGVGDRHLENILIKTKENFINKSPENYKYLFSDFINIEGGEVEIKEVNN